MKTLRGARAGPAAGARLRPAGPASDGGGWPPLALPEAPDAVSPADLTGRQHPPRVPGWRPLRVAMIGQKGIPATYGGVEHHVEELGSRLAELGHDVTVYCRSSYETELLETYRGMRLRQLPAAGTKHLDAISHSAVSTIAAMAAHHDVIHYHALGPGLLSPLPRFASAGRVVLTVHGLDHLRGKWGRGARFLLGGAHWMSGHVPDRTIVVSRALASHYAERFGRDATYIPNGVNPADRRPAGEIVERFGLEPGTYVLFVGRLVPEKAPDLLLHAFRRVPGDTRLVLAGSSSFTDGYTTEIRRLAAEDPRVVLTGYCFGDLLAELYSNAALFVLPSLLEGLPLTLLEAASYGLPVVASNIPPHLEVLGIDGPGRRVVPAGDAPALAAALACSLQMIADERLGGAALCGEVLSAYRWDAVAAEVEKVYLDVVLGAPTRAPSGPLAQKTTPTREDWSWER